MTSRKQMLIEGLQAPELEKLDHFTLNGEGFDFDPDRNEVWPMPPGGAWVPAPKVSVWDQLVESVKGATT